MKIKKIFSAVIVLLFFILTSCAYEYPEELVGSRYSLSEESNGTVEMTYTFTASGKATMVMVSTHKNGRSLTQTFEGDYKPKGGKLNAALNSSAMTVSDNSSYTVNGNTLTVVNDRGETAVFERVSS